jgi:hypothetical protein
MSCADKENDSFKKWPTRGMSHGFAQQLLYEFSLTNEIVN